jgi:1-acyl-sn-glycerol-3-phosphate acyltransferase
VLDQLKSWVGNAVAEAILFASRAWTGVRPLWIGSIPEKRQRVYFANHGSHGDFVMIWACLPAHLRRQTRPVAGQDYWVSSPLKKFAATRVFKALLINRHPSPDEPSPVDLMEQVLENGESLILFPEGTRNTTESPLLAFKSGLYHLSKQYPQAEFIPVWIDNIRRVIPKGELFPVPMVCTVSFGETIHLEKDEGKEAFLAKSHKAVLSLRPKESLTHV